MPVRLGISPIGWSNDDLPELGGDVPLDRCLAEARAAGYEGIEVGHKFPRDPPVLRQILERFGLALISGWYSGRLLDRTLPSFDRKPLIYLQRVASVCLRGKRDAEQIEGAVLCGG